MARRRGFTLWDVLIVGFLVLVVLIMVYPVFVRERGSRINVCLSNVKNIALAIQMYVVDNGSHFPPAPIWCDALDEYVKNRDVFRCPQARGKSGWDYAFNAALDRQDFEKLRKPEATVVIFESDLGRNASGGRRDLPAVPRHLNGDNYGFADGHASWAKRKAWGEDKRGSPIWLKEPEQPLWWQP
jgi:prepilin-type processing-associated H-X9-DG protein